MKKEEPGLFRGQSEDLGLPSQVFVDKLAKLFMRQTQTIADNRYVNSFHSYFLRPGDSHKPIVYDVNLSVMVAHDTRRQCYSNKVPIFYMTVSSKSLKGFEHQDMMHKSLFQNDLIPKMKY